MANLIQTIDLNQIPSVTRLRTSPLVATPEYKAISEALATIKPGKAIKVPVGKETMKLGGKNCGFMMKRHIQKLVEATNLKLVVELRTKGEETPVLYVSNPGTAKK